MSAESKADSSSEPRIDTGFRPLPWVLLASILGITTIYLRHTGRRWWCKFGRPIPWWGGVNDGHTSQHLTDPYSFSHVLHGLLFYALLRPLAGRLRWEVRLVLAITLECLWEMAENSTWVIERYRRSTMALGYEGDSVLNSLGDIACCGIGFLLAWRLPVRWSIALFLAVEVGMLVAYRDNLLLNVIMLLYPFDGLKTWQMGG
ncbi:MAG TPA: DUF2585 family protein [Isosphaeraceae bacterium]|nr:DUF2585 family protein [Isosphaeraceae bacterium]